MTTSLGSSAFFSFYVGEVSVICCSLFLRLLVRVREGIVKRLLSSHRQIFDPFFQTTNNKYFLTIYRELGPDFNIIRLVNTMQTRVTIKLTVQLYIGLRKHPVGRITSNS
jgi:hypothetical protein